MQGIEKEWAGFAISRVKGLIWIVFRDFIRNGKREREWESVSGKWEDLSRKSNKLHSIEGWIEIEGELYYGIRIEIDEESSRKMLRIDKDDCYFE